MNQRCSAKIQGVKETLAEVVDALDHLVEGIDADNEEDVSEALEMMPTARVITKAVEDLGMILRNAPWESGRKGKKNG